MRTILLSGVASGALVVALTAGAQSNEGTRFAVRAEIQTVGHSEDHRYALSAVLRQTPSTTSTDGRFALKAVNVPQAGCEPSLELFANGFEGN